MSQHVASRIDIAGPHERLVQRLLSTLDLLVAQQDAQHVGGASASVLRAAPQPGKKELLLVSECLYFACICHTRRLPAAPVLAVCDRLRICAAKLGACETTDLVLLSVLGAMLVPPIEQSQERAAWCCQLQAAI